MTQATWIRMGVVLHLLFGMGCTPPPVPFQQAQIFPEDQVEAPNPPSPEELIPPRDVIAFSPVRTHAKLTRYHEALSLAFTQSALEEVGNLQITPEQRVTRTLEFSEFLNFNPDSVEAAVNLGKHLNVKYIAMLSLTPSASKVGKGDWAAFVYFRVYQIAPQRAVMEESFDFALSRSREVWKSFKNKVQASFPVRGFILESRNRHAYVRISLGKKYGIDPQRSFGIFRRIIEAKPLPDGSTLHSESYQRIGQMQVQEVYEEESWGVVAPQDQSRILKGDVVFTNPE
ncbi:hypothetical protein WDW89_06075 [Deltaproteobacteria bacterium TL4]